ncbi:MAG: acyl-CoA dehydrogenase [Rhodospirillaceae bacterium]|nr:acyl-CoA dehydrogenase [Rhodospirillaceae bacterium]MBT3910077.1 acyl-CoA dehydrogenase [Rhodospirillaceae bacterium]MBT5299601.1 acyl-CoA dehydrogenase [Rhodospirillaceae bacterium]MBT6084602.1 acyl-CoA dehydrogenase [Rhodospirillaceae bacterium]MBT6885800.1 acyl-CoA dehydrogenase [Rhodospirillaceae bacterium]
MANYHAPLDEMRFIIQDVVGLEPITALPGCEDVMPDLVDAILEEAGKLGAEVLAPINHSGDEQGCSLENGVVRTPEGFPEAYRQYVEGGWNGLAADVEFGGQGLPWLISTAVSEIWHASNMAFGLCPMLTQGAVELLGAHGSADLKAVYMEKMVSGEWTGTMNLTEPQAGSDLGRVRTKAVPEDNHYRISGTKIFITHGDHDMADNIIHMVLARTPDAPEGVRGISLFVVPKFMVNEDGIPSERNDLRCVSLEHKLGINASPTAVMSFGDDGGAIGYLVGEENHGLAYMFTMMNNERLAVGLQGIGVGERAYQHARDFARERIQSRKIDGDSAEPVAIIEHPDVKRMLMSMRSQTEATRALAYYVAGQLDIACRHPDIETRQASQSLVDLLTPVVKAWGSDTSIEVASTGIQVHGGMGFIEETGAAQFYRDARITAIYEGTNGIQANDLIGRKIGRENGETAKVLIGLIRDFLDSAKSNDDEDLAVLCEALTEAVTALETATNWVCETWKSDVAAVAAGAVPYLRLLGLVGGGWMMARSAEISIGSLSKGNGDPTFHRTKIMSARFFADHFLTEAPGLARSVTNGWTSVSAAAADQF